MFGVMHFRERELALMCQGRRVGGAASEETWAGDEPSGGG
jgi:hypothetical protein